jgi:hypothetical protein
MVKHLFDDGNLYGWLADGHLNDEPLMRRRRLCGRCLFYKARIADQSGFARRFVEVPLFSCYSWRGTAQSNNPLPSILPRATGFHSQRAATMSLSV